MISPRTTATTKISIEASRNASCFWPCSSFSVNTGTNAPWIAASANRLRTVFGIRKAIVKADIGALVPKYLAAKTSRTRPATRENAVAIEKKAVERARRPDRGAGGLASGAPTAASPSLTTPSL